jgi:hypothetical protein
MFSMSQRNETIFLHAGVENLRSAGRARWESSLLGHPGAEFFRGKRESAQEKKKGAKETNEEGPNQIVELTMDRITRTEKGDIFKEL